MNVAIGILIFILIIICLILLFLLLLLLVPSKYHVKLKYDEDLKIKAVWNILFGVVSVVFQKNEKQALLLKIPFRKIVLYYSDSTKTHEDEQFVSNDQRENSVYDKQDIHKKIHHAKATEAKDDIIESIKPNDVEKSDEKRINKIKAKIKVIVLKIKTIYDKIISEFIYYKDILTSDGFKDLCIYLKKKIKKTYAILAPKKLSGRVRYGASDPYETGRFAVWAASLYPIYGDSIEVWPIFDKEEKYAYIEASGSFRIASVLIIAMQLYLNKELRRYLSLIKKEEA